MSKKKYLSLEEAAAQLSMGTEELLRMREDGDIRGFADRGTWKFKVEDVAELGRQLIGDSNPEVPILDEGDFESSKVIRLDDPLSTSDSDVRLVLDNDALDNDSAAALLDSDSDIRLTNDSDKELDSDSDIKIHDAGDETISEMVIPQITDEMDELATHSELAVTRGDPLLSSDGEMKIFDDLSASTAETDMVAEEEPIMIGDAEDDWANESLSDVRLTAGNSHDESLSDVVLVPAEAESDEVEEPFMIADEEVEEEQPVFVAEEDEEPLMIVEEDEAAVAEEEPVMVFDEDEAAELADSDAEVHLDEAELDSDLDVMLVGNAGDIVEEDALSGSDSDVKLVADQGFDLESEVEAFDDSDSDVKLVGVDAETLEHDQVPVMDTEAALAQLEQDSDSDVMLMDPSMSPEMASSGEIEVTADTSESDVALLQSEDSSIAIDFESDDSDSASVLSDESGIALGGDSGMYLGAESGISLEGASDSGISLEADSDEGITLAPLSQGGSGLLGSGILGSGILGGASESGISLTDDSGIALAGDSDSGISLADDDEGITLAEDSGISLTASDSGIALEAVGDSGISLEDSADFGGTIPMMNVGDDDEVAETKFEIPAIRGDDDDYDMPAKGKGKSKGKANVKNLGDQTAVLDLDDDDQTAALDDAAFDLDDDVAADDELSADDDYGGGDDAFADDEMADDVLGADDDVFESEGEEFASPAARGVAAPVSQEWGAGTVVGLLMSTVALALVGAVMFDLVNTMWATGTKNPVSSGLISTLGSLYRK